MSGQAISLVTKGMICRIGTLIQKFCIPLNFSVSRNVIKLNLSKKLPMKINISNSNVTKLTIRAKQSKLNINTEKIKININKICG